MNTKIYIRNKISTINFRCTQFILKHDENYLSIQWQIYSQKLSTNFLPEFDVLTPLQENTANIFSDNPLELNIILPENSKLKIRVRFQKVNKSFTDWTNFFEFTSKQYNNLTPFKQIDPTLLMTNGATLEYNENGENL